MNLMEALSLKDKEVISLVGGGGKTTLMFSLSSVLSPHGYCVISTMTTKILYPSAGESPRTILVDEEPNFPDSVVSEIINIGV